MGDALLRMQHEHRVIERVLVALDRFAAVAGEARDPDADLAAFVRFFRAYADGIHHAREEQVLFAALRHHAFHAAIGPITALTHEHVVGRQLVDHLASTPPCARPWSAAVRTDVRETATHLCALLGPHIDKEDSHLFLIARHELPAAARAGVDAACDQLTRQDHASGRTPRLEALATDLAARYT